ncbi:hypothetical protein [Listeria booriae]|uniref:hypothetical protein n=1 Tax=Listeria booriae TaxID=1552123 RepID=UPI0016285F71|nr:hypothetical protein [Listeria booriae]MBC2106117.1 hypothetical protein [Listeria booriae]
MTKEIDITAKVKQHILSKGYLWTDPRVFTFPQSSDGSVGVVIDGKGFTQCADIEDVIETLLTMKYTSESIEVKGTWNKEKITEIENRVTNIKLIQRNLEHDLDALTGVLLDLVIEEARSVLDLRNKITTENITEMLSRVDSRLDKDTELVIKSKLRNRVEKYVNSIKFQR